MTATPGRQLLGLVIVRRHDDTFDVVASRLTDASLSSDHAHAHDLKQVIHAMGRAVHATFAPETTVIDEASRILEERP